MLSALMIKANIDAGKTSEDQGVYDVVLIAIQLMAPLLTVLTLLKKGQTAAMNYAALRASRASRAESEEQSGRRSTEQQFRRLQTFRIEGWRWRRRRSKEEEEDYRRERAKQEERDTNSHGRIGGRANRTA